MAKAAKATAPAQAGTAPPRKLGEHGSALWARVMAEYQIADAGGVELLAQACGALDRAEALRAASAATARSSTARAAPRLTPA